MMTFHTVDSGRTSGGREGGGGTELTGRKKMLVLCPFMGKVDDIRDVNGRCNNSQ